MKQISNKSKNIILTVMSLVFVAVMIMSVYEMCSYRERTVKYETDSEYAGYCENMASIFITEYADNVSEGVSNPLQSAVDTVFGSYRGGHEVFNILVTKEQVLFFRSTEETEEYSGMDLQTYTDTLIKAGADNIDELRALIDGSKSGSVRMTFDKSDDYYLAYYHNFKVDGKDYGMIHLVLESYFNSNAKIDQHFMYMMVEVGIVGILMIIILFATAYITRRYNKLFKHMESEVDKYQANICELNEKIESDKKSVKHGNVKDEVLGVYSSYFMNSLVIDAENRGVDASVAVIGASYRSRYNRQVWNDFIAYMKESLKDNYILGMVDDKHLVLLGISCDDAGFREDVTSMLDGAKKILSDDDFDPVYVFDKKKEESDTISRALKDAVSAFDSNIL